jgi:hypothetical protein
MLIEKTEIWITTEKALQFIDVRAVSGFVGNLYMNRVKLYWHIGEVKIC